MRHAFRAVKGMKDILPEQSRVWIYFESVVRDWLLQYGYENIRTPILEYTHLFLRSIGQTTDIVEKEMYSFIDQLNNENLTLRPEGTAPCLRAVSEHSLLYNATQRLWYQGPMFRHERPQKGRYREFHQVGVEALGLSKPDIDAEMILMTADLWQRLGITHHIELQVNTLGTKEERAKYKTVLIEYLEKHKTILDEDSLRRMYKNPLRVLDTKKPELQEMCENAPQLFDFLKQESKEHYESWLNYLSALGIPFKENRRLVRGLDYYNLSVFEWVYIKNDIPLTFCAGGRYNGLLAELGESDKPGIGFAMGMERVLMILEENQLIRLEKSLDVYLIHLGERVGVYCLQIARQVRNLGYTIKQDFEQTSFKSQLKRAIAHGTKIALFITESEMETETMNIKNLSTKEEKTIPIQELPEVLDLWIRM